MCIMSCVDVEIKENVVIDINDNYNPLTQSCQELGEEELKPIDMNNRNELMKELERLRCIRLKYSSIDNIPSPTHIIRADYGHDRKAYQHAKDIYFKEYRARCKKLNDNIAVIQNANTKLCRESKEKEDKIKIKNGTFYNGDELAHLDEIAKLKKERRRLTLSKASKKYYNKNKDELKIKKRIKDAKDLLESIQEEKKGQQNVLIRAGKIIKPLCLCGRQCDVLQFKTLKTHSNIEKHKLFKSIIRLIHYNRRNRKLKPVIDKINNQLNDYKRVIREKRNGKSVTLTNKTDKETIIYYTDLVEPIDENITHQPRKSYIEKKQYTQKYKDNREIIYYRINPRIIKN